MLKNQLQTSSEAELIQAGLEFSKSLKPKDIIILNGDLGAGKTTFVKGIAKGLGITRPVTSPTFNIVKEYNDVLCHIDAYRVFAEDIGIDDYLDRNFIICIEWSENIIDYIPQIDYEINLEYQEEGRNITIIKHSD